MVVNIIEEKLPILDRLENILLFIETNITLDTLISITAIIIGLVLIWTVIKDKK